jgi:hypothetical protein
MSQAGTIRMLCAAVVTVAMLSQDADARSRRGRGRYRPPHVCIYKPNYATGTVNSTVIPPSGNNPEENARYTIWLRDKNVHDHKLSAAEVAGLPQKALLEIDTNKNGFLELPEMTAYFQRLNQERKGGTSGSSGSGTKSKSGGN